MTAKEYVKSKYPKAYAEKQTRRGPFKQFYWLIFSERGVNATRLGESEDNKPESAAWTNARYNITEALIF